VGRWSRTTALAPHGSQRRVETWTSPDGAAFPVDVTVSKALDVLALKDTSLAAVIEYARFLQSTANELYTDREPALTSCPCCASPSSYAVEALQVFGIAYVRCPTCGHGYVRDQPSRAALNALFQGSEEHSGVYIDPATTEVRLAQVVRPKVQWVLAAYESALAGSPSTMIDVGAGGGHMVRGFQEAGLSAAGYELSSASRAFAAEHLRIDLLDADFLTSSGDPVDLVTMWGLLEYTADPAPFIAVARERLGSGGMLVVEVPRFDSLGTAVQGIPGAVVARHLDPTSHLNCFSDESLATVLLAGGFRPVAAWYFGMDAYELLVQLALRIDDEGTLAALARPILDLQQTLDGALLCDDIVVAAVPL